MTQDNQETETTPTAKALPGSSGSLARLMVLENIAIYIICGYTLICGGSAWVLLLLIFVNMRTTKKKKPANLEDAHDAERR